MIRTPDTYGPYGGNIFALKMGVPADQKEQGNCCPEI